MTAGRDTAIVIGFEDPRILGAAVAAHAVAQLPHLRRQMDSTPSDRTGCAGKRSRILPQRLRLLETSGPGLRGRRRCGFSSPDAL
jgi:hypothetical protein